LIGTPSHPTYMCTRKTIPLHPKAKALIFDLDGTLADTMPTHYRSWQIVAERHGFSFPEGLFYELAGVPTVRIAEILNERFGYKLDPEQMEEEKEGAYLALAQNRALPIVPVVTTLREYAGRYPVACGTGNIREIAELTLKLLEIDDLLPILVTAEDVARTKPAPDTFLRCAELMGVAPEVCQVFEDGEPGLTAAKSAGMYPTDIRKYL